jgi:hypothetical protein
MAHFIDCYADCNYAECHYAECRGAQWYTQLPFPDCRSSDRLEIRPRGVALLGQPVQPQRPLPGPTPSHRHLRLQLRVSTPGANVIKLFTAVIYEFS